MKVSMGRRIPLIFLALSLAISFLPLWAQGRRVALVIGNSGYAVGPLRNPANDAADMAKALREMGFAVVMGRDATKKSMYQLIDQFGADIRGADIALFFYSGHGVQADGENFLIPVGADISFASDVEIEGVQLQRLIGRMNAGGAGTNVVILDACRNNPFPKAAKGMEKGLAIVGQKPPESVIVYATEAGETADDGTGSNGVFTAALLRNLRRNEELTTLLREVNAEVRRDTNQKQKPAKYDNLTRAVYLGGKGAPESSPGAAASTTPSTLGSTSATAAKPRLTVARSYGSLVINAATAGELYLDGASLGELPAGSGSQLDDVEAGERSLEMHYANGERETLIVTVQKGVQTPAVFTWRKVQTGTLVVRTDPPGARVFVNGSDKGQSPLSLRDLGLGYVSVAVSQSGYEDISQQKLIEAGNTTEVAYVLKKKAPAQAPSGSVAAVGGFVRVPAGTYTMGSPASENSRGANEGPQHEVRLAAFTIGQYEVTQGEWKAVMGSNPSNFKGDDRLPVEQVSWYDILVHCNKRSLAEGLNPCYSISGSSDPVRWGSAPTSSNSTWDAARCDSSVNGYRLPTEAEWEYACRAGTKTATTYGDTLVSSQANFDGSDNNASTKGTYLQKTVPVGSYQPNAWGIYDMHGNVWEWCWDWYEEKYYAGSPGSDPRGADAGLYRVIRGGGWGSGGSYQRSASRNRVDPVNRIKGVGFRVVVGR